MQTPPPERRPTALMTLWRAVAEWGEPLIKSHLQARARRGKEDPVRLNERFGIAGAQRPAGELIWLHAASVGESLSVLSLVEKLLTAKPTRHVLITTGTTTSAALMAERLPASAIHQYVPFDRPSYVRAFLDHWKPDLAVWVESELWPNMIYETHARAIPLALINARMSKKSYRGWRNWRGTARTLLNAFDLILAQDEATADRLHDLGAKHTRVVGNIKLSATPLTCDEAELAALKAAIGDRPLWCAASIYAREEAMILDAHVQIKSQTNNVLTIIAPRQPGRGMAIVDAAKAKGLNVALRSAHQPLTPDTEIYVANTIGEMGLFFRLAPLAFLGRSLINKGGSNPMEAPPLRCAVLAGPYTDNFNTLYAELDRRGGVARVSDVADLAAQVAALIADEPARTRLNEAALTLIAEAHEVLDATANALEDIMQGSPDAAA